MLIRTYKVNTTMERGFLKHLTSGAQVIKYILAFLLLPLFQLTASAQDKPIPETTSTVFSNPLFIALLSIVILLLIVIILYAEVVKAAANYGVEHEKRKNSSSSALKGLLVLILASSATGGLFAQPVIKKVESANNLYYGLDSTTFYLMMFVIVIELFFIRMLYKISIDLLNTGTTIDQGAEAKEVVVRKKPSIIEKFNSSVSLEKESDIMLDHNYDGIRELDNNLPPWWKYGFYVSIVWAVVYLVHFHVTHTGKLQLAEYEDQLSIAKTEIEEYRKNASNLVDESNVTLLTDEASLASGKSVYMTNCAVCHGQGGEGGVGPNLTDDYWIHKGGIKDIFKTVKYGWPEKGMKAWQQDLGAKQMHEVSSYIKTLVGTNPANPKDKQGELYIEESGSDSAKVVITDSLQIVQR